MFKSIAIIAATLAGNEAIIITNGKPAAESVSAKDVICKFAASKSSIDGWYAYMDTEHFNRLSNQDF